MEKKIDTWVPSPDDTLDNLVSVQKIVLEDFAKLSGVALPRPVDISFTVAEVVEIDHTEVVAQSANGSRFIRIVRKIFRKNGSTAKGDGNGH